MEFLGPVKAAFADANNLKIEYGQEDLELWGINGVQLRSYQLDGFRWIAERHKIGHGCILGDEMGLGKTLQSISFLIYLYAHSDCSNPTLVLAPLSVIDNWQSELTRFAPCLHVANYSGNKEQREEQRTEITDHVTQQSSNWKRAKYPFHIMLANYEVVIRDTAFMQRIPWQCLVVDEGHRLKNSSSVLYSLLTQFDVGFPLLLTGTPVQNNLTELYALLSFIAPKLFKLSKMEKFLTTFSSIKDDEVAKTLHSVLEPFLLRRTKNEVLVDLPAKSEVILYAGLSATQKKYYKAILMKDLAAFGEAGSKTRLMNILTQLRKCVNHPYLFDGVEPEPFELGEHLVDASGKLFIIDKLLSHLQSRGHRVLLFSQMTRMLDIIQDYLGYRGYSYERLDGSVRGEERFLAVKNFSKNDETFIFLLSTRAGGQGLNLAGADTIIFLDSDFNPQNDLQAAARAHRLGQTRPVKVIRLVCRHTVEEIILKRALVKLKLTQMVIEGGQFSRGVVGVGGASDLSEIIKYGLDLLLQSEETTLVDEDLESVLGRSEEGQWVVELTQDHTHKQDDSQTAEAPENIYVYEGEDYSKASDSDKKSFDQLLAEQLVIAESALGERVLRGERLVPLSLPAAGPSRKRKPLTQEQLQERRRKREEAKAKRMKMLEEREQKRLEEKQRKKQAYWDRHDYTSLNISLESEESSDEDEGADECGSEGVEECGSEGVDNDIQYLVGDVTRPQQTGSSDAIIVHCVDDSGRWGKGGLFSALSSRSLLPQTHYELAGRMRDLSLGDAHFVPIDDRMSREMGSDMVALVVAQRREAGGLLSEIRLSALNTGLLRVAKMARKNKASVHLPRIGHSTPNFNWYGTERLVRKHLSSRGIPTFIYYFPRQPGSSIQHSVSTLHTSTPSHSLLPQDCAPLPNIFTGLTFYLHLLEPQIKSNLTRYIVAYDGDVTDTVTMETTHILCRDDTSSASITKKVGVINSAVVLYWKWVEQCLKDRKLTTHDEFIR